MSSDLYQQENDYDQYEGAMSNEGNVQPSTAAKPNVNSSNDQNHPPLDEISPLQIEENNLCNKENSECLKIIIISSVVFSIAVLISLVVSIIYTPQQTDGIANIVLTDSSYCSKIGGDLLEEGGNAVDAAVACTFCEGVVAMHLTGVASGGFLIVRIEEDKDTKVFNFREMNPESDLEVTDELGTMVGIPGTVDGLYTAHSMYGKKDWKDLLNPSIDLARNGFKVSESLSTFFSTLSSMTLESLTTSTNTSEGATITLDHLANVLVTIRDSGVSALYTGDIVASIISEVNKNGGNMNESDFTKYETFITEPVSTRFKEMVVDTSPAPSSGPILAMILNVLNIIDIDGNDDTTNFLLTHKIIEVIKYGMGNLYKIGDSETSADNVDEFLTSEYAVQISRLIGNETKPWANYTSMPTFQVNPITGKHVIVKDTSSNYVSVVTSLGDPTQEKIAVSGFLMNNALLSFVHSSMNNGKAPFRRPAFYLAPAVVHSDGRPCGIDAALSGSVNAVTVGDMAQVIARMLSFRMNITSATTKNRFQYPIGFGNITYDGKVSDDLLTSLRDRGHYPSAVSKQLLDHISGISFINDTIDASLDPRADAGSQDLR